MHAHRGQAFQGVTPSFHLSNYQLSKQRYFVVCPLTSYRQRTSRTDPEYYQAVVRIPSAHILYQRDLSLCVLLWVPVRTVGAVCQRVNISIVFLLPTIDILTTRLVADSSLRDAMLHRILNYCLLIPHVLCYLIHSE